MRYWKKLVLGLGLGALFSFPQIARGADQDLVSNQGERFSVMKKNMIDNSTGAYDPQKRAKETAFTSSELQPRTIFGEDDRRRVEDTTKFPYSAVVFIQVTYEDGSIYNGTGSMISSDTVLTAAHIIYDRERKQWAKEVEVHAGLVDHFPTLGYTKSSKLLALDGWLTNQYVPYAFDLGLIKLQEPIGFDTGWFGLSDQAEQPGLPITSIGFPGDKPAQSMWEVAGSVAWFTYENLHYHFDTFDGQSGSPVLNTQQQILAVNAYSGTETNFGTRTNPTVISWIEQESQRSQFDEIFRMYNPNSGEHFYTKDPNEVASLTQAGWQDEGHAWFTLKNGPVVYRLYNPNAGEHHYTVNEAEKSHLLTLGWQDEGISWQATPADYGSAQPIYRVYNPYAQIGTHHYTLNSSERDYLTNLGWQDEQIAWYGI